LTGNSGREKHLQGKDFTKGATYSGGLRKRKKKDEAKERNN